MEITRAIENDKEQINKLLFQVHNLHYEIRPDIFKHNMKKYNEEELSEIIVDDNRPIFVAKINGNIVGYIFCIIINNEKSNSLTNIKTLYVDDLCIDKEFQNTGIGKQLLNYVYEFAKKIGCYNITLNVWNGNDNAFEFYKKNEFNIQKFYLEKIIK